MNTMTITAGAMSPAWDIPKRARRTLRDLFSPLILAITTAMCTSFKQELLQAVHNFSANGSNMRMALFDSTVTLDATTTVYATANEVVGAGYTAGGKLLANTTTANAGTTAFVDFDDLVWTASTFTTRGAQIFNNSAANRSVAVFDFGANVSVTAGNLTVVFPTANATAAVLRIA